MVGRPLRALALASSILVLLGVLLFALDQLHAASDDAQARLDSNVPTYWPGSAEARRAAMQDIAADTSKAAPTRFESVVTEANSVLRAPFTGLVPPTADAWTRELVPAFLALLLWGVGLTALANLVARRPSPRQRYVSTHMP